MGPLRILAWVVVAVASETIDVRGTAVSPLFLRLNDPGGITANGQRTFEIADVVEGNLSAVAAHAVDDAGLRVEWADGTASVYDDAWLDAHVFRAAAYSGTGARDWAGAPARIPYAADGATRVAVARAVVESGLAVLADVPTTPGTVLAVGDWLGFVRRTNYGDLFDVRDDGARAANLANTAVRIRAHTDNPYRDPFPGVQMLHCLRAAPAGGATTFTDGFAAAEALRARDPGAFELLATVAHPYEYRGADGVLLRAAAPVLGLDAGGRVARVALNNRSAGKLRGVSPAFLERYYAAWAAFDALCNSDEFLVRVVLEPGDLAVFSNARVLHGRDAFVDDPEHARWFQGAYIDMDALRSTADGAAAAVDARVAAAVAAVASQAAFSYGEGVDMLEHALQAAAAAADAGEPEGVVVAALLHDVGNAPRARDAWVAAGHAAPKLLTSPSDGSIGYEHHSAIGAAFAASLGFPADVSGAVGLHVPAKRALVARDPAYLGELSQASLDTLAHQGGPMDDAELAAFAATPGADAALRLRRYDDRGKVAGKRVPRLAAYEPALRSQLARGGAATCGADVI